MAQQRHAGRVSILAALLGLFLLLFLFLALCFVVPFFFVSFSILLPLIWGILV